MSFFPKRTQFFLSNFSASSSNQSTSSSRYSLYEWRTLSKHTYRLHVTASHALHAGSHYEQRTQFGEPGNQQFGYDIIAPTLGTVLCHVETLS